MAGLQDISPMVASFVGYEHRLGAKARGGGCGLSAGMTATNDDDIEFLATAGAHAVFLHRFSNFA